MLIDKKTYKVEEFNYYKTKIAKSQILIGTSLRASNHHIIRLKHKDLGKNKKWPAYSISRHGVIFQHFESQYHSDFTGIKDVDIKTISIVLENMGALSRTNTGQYTNWLNETCDPTNILNKKFVGFEYWEKFTEAQIESLSDLCQMLCDKHNIPKECIDFNHYNKEMIKYRGISFFSNYFEESMDINPSFNIENFNEMLSTD